jgi:hypothetical protein
MEQIFWGQSNFAPFWLKSNQFKRRRANQI